MVLNLVLRRDRSNVRNCRVEGGYARGPAAVDIALAATDPDVRVVLAERRDLPDQIYEALP
jgi:hypothetical protein